MALIQVNQLTKRYGKHRGIENVSFQVMPGEFFGCIGPNGAGKSTLIRTLLGLLKPSDGSFKIMNTADASTARKDIGYISSESVFYGGLRGIDILKLSENIHGKSCKERREELINRLAFDPKKRVRELSLGNRKKLAIINAMQHAPSLYLFDEPTSGLDPLMQQEFFALMREEHERGATFFYSSHILSEIQRFAGRTLLMKDGQATLLDNMDTLNEKQTKKVHLRGVTSVPSYLNATDVAVGIGEVSFTYAGDINALMKVLSGLPLQDITIHEPPIEESLMHFYKREGL